MKVNYSFTYTGSKATAIFLVDTSKFTAEKATAVLEYFTWRYNREANPINELMNKLALKVIFVATANNFNASGVKDFFMEYPGMPRLDGSHGITLLAAGANELREENLQCVIK